MKKLLLLLASLSLVLAACSGDKEETKETTNEETTTSEGKVNPAGDMMKFYLSISNSINEVDADLNAYESAKAVEELPEGTELKTMQDAAKTAADNAAVKVEELEVPAELKDQQEAIDSALTKMHEAYTLKSEALAAEGEVVLDKANAKFEEADAELNKVLEEVGLAGSSILNEVSL
ncbi:hypothetical protein [Paenisporosarcina sp. TG-14]|uniref:hypothetical protein n=1 Tax=Paenisporosarcina sp. TG-14 TaxID=1231057 RepID=UPI0002EC4A81|nr:hypothetical protein [Paenisporosarcina sp. TG-14]